MSQFDGKLLSGHNNLPVRLQKALRSCTGTPSVCHMLCMNNARPSQQQDSAFLSLPQKVNWGRSDLEMREEISLILV